jgi:hypothetical protein
MSRKVKQILADIRRVEEHNPTNTQDKLNDVVLLQVLKDELHAKYAERMLVPSALW